MYAAAPIYRELYGKIPDRDKKLCKKTILFEIKFFLCQMCRDLVCGANFRAILTPFSEVT